MRPDLPVPKAKQGLVVLLIQQTRALDVSEGPLVIRGGIVAIAIGNSPKWPLAQAEVAFIHRLRSPESARMAACPHRSNRPPG